ncbi:MAG: hypothetical protein IJV15_08080 [Lachnospiraceae bacterium]|nr:hypothetical protein [Lachnospiraceae bacterium]
MDDLFLSKLNEKQKTFKNAGNETNEQFAERFGNVNQTIQNNLKDMQGYVDNKIFSGELEQKEKEKNLDYSHDYVLLDVKRDVYTANKNVYDNIRKFGKAEPTEEDKKKKGSITGFFKKFANQFVEEFHGKEKNYQTALYNVAREQNANADKTTALELSRLLKYSESIYNVLDIKNEPSFFNKGSVFNQVAAKHLKGVKKGELKQKKHELFTHFRYDVAPFMKNYKTKWFFGTRYYNLDGKRLKAKSGELNPEEYNKALIEGLMLETKKGAKLPDGSTIDSKTLTKNRKQKAAVLTRITKELIEYGDKFDPKQMTDLYISNHIIELQEYYARLNAFQQLVIDNQWFFLGKENAKKIAGKPYQDITDAADPNFANLVKTHILDMRAPVSNFIEAHLRSHCLKSDAKFNKRKNYFRNDEKQPFVVVGEDVDEVDDVKLDRSVDLDGIQSELIDVEERGERYAAFGEEFSVVDMSKMSDEEKKNYETRLSREKSYRDGGLTGQILTNKLNKIRYEQTRSLSKDLTFQLKKELDKIKDDARKNVENYNKTENEEKNKVPVIPYASMSAANLDDTVLIDLQYIKQRINSEKGSYMYMNFGPEIDLIYGKMYAAARLQAELSARKKAIDSKLRLTNIRRLEKDIKEKKGTKLTRKSWQEEIDKQKKKNHEAMMLTSKNVYARFSEDYLADERLKRAEREFDEISKKIEYTKTELDMCKKTIRFFIGDPTEKRMEKNTDYAIIENFLKKEKLGYMFEVNKIDDYDELLDAALLDTEKDLQKEAGKNAVPQDVKKADRSYRARAARIHQVRQRGRLFIDTNKTLIAGKTSFSDPDAEFAKLVKMKPEELAKFNYETSIPVGTKEQKKAVIEQMKLLSYIAAKAGKFNPKFYDNRVNMVQLFENYKKTGIIPKTTQYGNFVADIKTKIELLTSWNNYVSGLFKLQGNKNYSYLDTDTLDGMSVHSLELLKKNLEEKAKKLDEEVKELGKNTKKKTNTEQKELKYGGEKFVIEASELEEDNANVSIAYRLRKEKWINCKELIDAVNRKISMAKSRDKYTEFNIEAYNHSINQKTLEANIEYAKYFSFPAANETYLVLCDLARTDKIKTLKNNRMFDRISRAKAKNDKYIKDEKNVEKEALGLVARLREIKIGPELYELAKKVIDENNVPNPDDVFTLLKYTDTLSDVECVIKADKSWSSEEQLALKSYFEKPENKELMAELVNKNEILSPLWSAFNTYLEANGMVGASNFSQTQTWWLFREKIEGDENLTEQQKKDKLEEEADKIQTESEKKMWAYGTSISKLKENINKAGDMISSNPTTRLFKLVHEGGEKLDISKADEWKKIFQSIKNKGYYNKKPAKGENTIWMKVAAEQILNLWPQSLEDFYIERAKLDTGKALDETFRKLAVENGTGVVEDTGHAAEISAVISKKEAFAYSALSMDKRRELDEALKHAGYNPRIFKYLLKDVEVNGAGQPATKEAEDNRSINNMVVNEFIYRNNKDSKAFFNPVIGWQDTVFGWFKEAVSFKITSEMTDPAYIKKHFEYLYGKTRKFLALKEVYEHEKHILEDPEVIKRKHIKPQVLTAIHNAFGPKTRSVYAMFFEMIEAYAHTYFVDKEGHFDMGLSADEIYGKDGKAIDKDANQRKLFDVLNKRKDYFKKMSMRVNSELDREELANKVAQSDEVSKTLNVIQVKGNERVIKLVQKKGFEGKISDINILLQSPKLAELVKEYNKNNQILEGYEESIKPLKNKLQLLYEEGKAGSEEYTELNQKILLSNSGTISHRAELATAETAIMQYQKENKVIYENYNACHNEDGTLNIYEKLKDGSVREHLGKYLDYQTSVARDCARIYHELKSFFGNAKNINEKTFTAENIVKRFKQNEMADRMRDLRKIDLYLNLLEVDKQGLKTKDHDIMKDMTTHINNIKTAHKKMKDDNPVRVNMKKQLAVQIEDYVFAQDFMKEVLKDMEGGPKNPVQMIHDYVQLVFLTLKSYGVTDEGDIVEEQIKDRVDGKLTEQEIKNIANDEADKIGDAHIELQHEINIRLGFEKKPEPAKRVSKKAEPKKETKKKETKKKETKKSSKGEINLDVDNINFEVLDDNLNKKKKK